MSIQDPIADLLTQIRNGQKARKKSIKLPSSKGKVAVVQVLQEEGYIESYNVIEEIAKKPVLEIKLKYYHGVPVIQRIDRVSRPGLRSYQAVDKLPKVLGGLGIAIISTSQGVMSDKQARKANCGGEVLCIVE